ncbi:MAG TPA: aldehyde dehydrogenase family protein, partial [Roseiarcus sp.]
RMAALKVGAGASPDTECGPMITRKAVNKIERLVADAVRRGASMLCGGRAPGRRGFHDLPTGLKDVPHNAAMAAEEIFGPVALERPEAGRLRTNHETC